MTDLDPENPLDPEDIVNDQYEQYVFLHPGKKIKWRIVIEQIIDVQDSDPWKILLIISIITYMVLITLDCFLFSGRLLLSLRVLVGITDFVYLVHFILTLTKYIYAKIQFKKTSIRCSIFTVILDLILLSPHCPGYEYIYDDTSSLTFFILRLPSCLRLLNVLWFFNEKRVSAGISHWTYFIVHYLINLVLVHHIFACAWCYLARSGDGAARKLRGWAVGKITLEQTFEPLSMYKSVFFFSMALTTGRGFNIFTPTNLDEQICAIAALAIGFLFISGFYIGPLVAELGNRYRRRDLLRIQLKNINKHLNTIRQMDKKTRDEVIVYYQTLWKEKKGVAKALELNLLPFPLRSEICFDINIQPLLNSLIFRSKPEYFLRMVAYKMKHEFYPRGTMIFNQGVVKNKMIFVVMGYIQILSEEDNQSPIITFGPGSCLGEASLITTLPAKASVKAITYTELQVLYREDFIQTIVLYPDLYLNIFQDIYERFYGAKREHTAQNTTRDITLSLFVSQYQNRTPIKLLKDKLSGVPMEEHPTLDKYSQLYKLATNVSNRKRIPFCVSESFPWIIHPESSFAACWEIMIIATTLMICIFYPFYVAFHRTFPDWFITVSTFLDFFLVVDVYIILTTAIVNKNRMITSVIKIFQYRLTKPGFYLDTMACFYIELFALVIESELTQDRIFYLLKLNRLLKSYRILLYILKLEDNLKMPIFLITMIKHAALFLSLIQFLAPLLYLVSCYDFTCVSDGWFYTKLKSDLNAELLDPCTAHPISISYYFAVQVIISVVVSDISVDNLLEFLIVYGTIIICILVHGFCIAQLAAVMTHTLKAENDFQGFLDSVYIYLDDKNIKKSIRKRIIHFFKLQWKYDKAISLGQNSLYYNASKKIQVDVVLKERMDTILQVPMFQEANLDFLQLLVTGAKSLILPPMEYISYTGAMMPELFIIREGYCIRFDPDGNKRVLYPGSHFGVAAILKGSLCYSTIQTLTHVKLISISEQVFGAATSMFPSIKNLFQEAVADASQTRIYKELMEEVGHIQAKNVHNISGASVDTALKGSFINVYRYCKRHGEDYSEPFDQLGYFSLIKYFLLPICLLPNGLCLKIWVWFRIAVAVFFAFVVPYQMTMAPHTPRLDAVVAYGDIVAFVDLYIMLFVGYYGKKNQLIFHPLRTANHYLQGKFFLDLVLCLPYGLIFLMIIPDHDEGHTERAHALSLHSSHCTLRMIKVFQAYRLPQALAHVKRNLHKKNAIWIVVINFFTFAFLVATFFGSVFLRISCRYLHRDDLPPKSIITIEGETFVHMDKMSWRALEDYAMFCFEDTWLDRTKFAEVSNENSIFLYAVYFCIDYIMGASTGEFTPQQLTILVIIMVMAIFGCLSFIFVYASTLSYRATIYTSLARYQEMAQELKSFLVQQKVDKALQSRVIKHFEHAWKRGGGTEAHTVLAHLNSALHEDTVLDMYEKILREVPLFEGVNDTFFGLLGQAIHEKYYLRGDTIFRAEDVIDHLFILFRGKVELVSSFNDTVSYMGPGGIFGNITSQMKRKIKVTVTTLTNVDVMYIKTDVFFNILKKYPAIKDNIERTLQRGLDFIMAANVIVDPEDNDMEDDKTTTSSGTINVGSSEFFSSRTAVSTASLGTVHHKYFFALFLVVMPHKWCRVAILPGDNIFTIIDILCVFFAYINCLVATYQFTFQEDLTLGMLIFTVFLDVLFFYKNFLELHKAYENHYGEFVTSNRKIAKKFFGENKWKRFFELSANLPIYYLAYIIANVFRSKNGDSIFMALRLTTVHRYIYIHDYYKEKSNTLLVNRTRLKCIMIFVSYTLLLHCLTCTYYFIGCPFRKCRPDSWNGFFNEDMSSIKAYVSAFYVTLDTFTLTSSCPAQLNTDDNFIYIMVFVVICRFFTGLLISDLANVYSSADAGRNDYEYGITKLRDYLQNENLSKFQMDKMWTYLRLLWKRDTGKQIPRLMRQMPYALKCDLMMEIYGHHLRKSYIFSGTEESFIRQLSGNLERVVFFPGNYIIQHGDSNMSMFFIHTGQMDILTVHPNLTETVHEVLGAGDMFGLNQGIFHGVPYTFSYRARTVVDIVRLYLPDWEELADFFPNSKRLIYKRAHDVYHKI